MDEKWKMVALVGAGFILGHWLFPKEGTSGQAGKGQLGELTISGVGVGGRGYADIPGQQQGAKAAIATYYVSNTSTKSGVPVAYTFKVNLHISEVSDPANVIYDSVTGIGFLGGIPISASLINLPVVAGGTRIEQKIQFDVPSDAPMGLYQGSLVLYKQDGVSVLDSISTVFSIVEGAIIPGGSVTWY